MALLKVYDINRNSVGEIEVSDEIFAAEVNENLFYEVVKMQLANRRRGTHSTKRRGEVQGATRKLFRQKGTGRARRGPIRTPVMKGGGSVFGPKPRDYSYTIPKKVRRGALISAISLRTREEKIIVLDSFELQEIKTKKVASILKAFGVTNPLIIEDDNEKLSKSAANIPGADVIASRGLNVYDILRHDHLIMTKATVEKVEGALRT